MPREGEISKETCRACDRTVVCRFVGEHKIGSFTSIPGWYCGDCEAQLVLMGIELAKPQNQPKGGK
jgi:hypothetical protein